MHVMVPYDMHTGSISSLLPASDEEAKSPSQDGMVQVK